MTTGVLRLAAAAAVAAVWSWAPHAQAGRPVFAPGSVEAARPLTPQQREERRFLQEAAAHLRFVHEASRLALTRSGSTAVRELAASIEEHHKQAHVQVIRLLHARGMAMPMPGNEHAKLLKQLGKAAGGKFDRLYLEEVGVRAHAIELRHHERAALAAQDAAVRTWAEQQQPGLRYRLAMAERALPGGDRRAQGKPGPPGPAASRVPM